MFLESYVLLAVAQTMSILFLSCEQDVSWKLFNFFRLIMADHCCHIRQDTMHIGVECARGTNVRRLTKAHGSLSEQPNSLISQTQLDSSMSSSSWLQAHFASKINKEIEGRQKEDFSNLEMLYYRDVIHDIPGLAYSILRQEEGNPLNTGDWKRQKNHPSWKR